jgi:hypothetical protein
VVFAQFIDLREGRDGARCVEQRRDGRGGRRDANIDDVPEIGVTCGRARKGRARL